MEKIYKGIMVIKTKQEEVKVEAPKEKDEKVEEGKAAPAEAQAETEEQKAEVEAQKDKTELRKYFRAYFPQWKLPIDKKRLAYESFIEVKKPTVNKSTDAPVVENINDEDEDADVIKAP